MNCKSVQIYLSAYLDGELNGQESLDVRDHLSGCRECQREEVQLKNLKQMLRGLPMYAPSEEFEERLVQNVVKVQAKQPRLRFGLGYNWRFATGFAVTAAVATLAVLQFTVHPSPESPKALTHDGLALEIGRDQMFIAGNDPLSGARFAVPTSYGKQ